MNCRKLQSYFEGRSLVADVQDDGSKVTEHISGCVSCRRFVETRNEIAARLRLLRDSAPSVPTSLDAAVLAKYRQQTAMRQSCVIAAPRWRTGLLSWGWATAVAAVLLISAAVFMLRRPLATTKAIPQTIPQVLVALPPQSSADAAHREGVRKDTVVRRTARRRKLEIAANQPTIAAVSAERPDRSLPEGFRSLMYCDELSCDGGMEVLRVQLPSAGAGFMPASASGNHMVSAEVLVGADGFARGIRIVH
jgi:hypothetical protein